MREVYHSFVALLERAFGSGGILAYHGVGQESFAPWIHVRADVLRSQFLELQGRYAFLPLSEFVNRLRAGFSVRGCLAVTFDDAYVGVCRYAAPILRELDVPATIFACSSLAEKGGSYWWDLVEDIRVRRNEHRWRRLCDCLELGGLSPDDPQASEMVKQQILLTWAGQGEAMGQVLGNEKPELGNPWRSATLRELEDLAADERFEFGCHTVSHAALPFLPPEAQQKEIRDNYEWLRDRLPRVRPFLAYPYGLYDSVTTEIAVRSGMTVAFTIEPRTPSRTELPMHVPRLCIQETTTRAEVSRRLARVHRPLQILARGRHHRLPSRKGTAP
jgi:peptidoglycan/xylan/chitin deacetylase (PgdA/CDA1 family)